MSLEKINNIILSINSKEDFYSSITKIHVLYQSLLDKKYKKDNGIYYTQFDLAYHLIEEVFDEVSISYNDFLKKTFLEPCVGIGSFVFAYLTYLEKKQLLNKENINIIISNVFVADIDNDAINIFKYLLEKYCLIFFNYNLPKSYYQSNIANGLLFEYHKENLSLRNPNLIFNNPNGFDFIITNPPYKNLKAESKDFDNEVDFKNKKIQYDKISKFVKKNFNYSNEGVLNLYKLFVEEILVSYSNKESVIILLIPATILNDKSCSKLRNLIFENNSVLFISCINESNNFFDGSQSLCSISLVSGGETNIIHYNDNIDLAKKTLYIDIDYKETTKILGNNSVIALSNRQLSIIKEMKKYPKLKDFSFIRNLRGELDLTINKSCYCTEETPFLLLRGRNISYYELKHINDDPLFVNPSFVQNSSKKEFIDKPRIVCQQVVNINKERRLSFALVEPNIILGNSCNFISLTDNHETISLYYLLGLFNSSLLNWFFKIGSSNNHVNNYEIDDFPIPTSPKNEIKMIEKLVKNILIENDVKMKEKLIQEIDVLVYKIFNIDNEINIKSKKSGKTSNLLKNFKFDLENLLCISVSDNLVKTLLSSKHENDIKLCLGNYFPKDNFIIKCLTSLIDKYQKFDAGYILNHTTFKLSELDLEMIKCVPQGGNWKNIHPDIIKKSKRLIRITETGGRTTLYGRINYNEPCYTITTYFNRPGNGTYVHPIHNRVLSVREAARIQSFDDSYYFIGSKSDYLKQIGNAVPPLLAYEIGKHIKSILEINTSIDLFAGAGGLTSGIKRAGIKSLMGIDFEERACITLKVNNPEIDVLCGDLTKKETKEQIYQKIGNTQVDMICGGPPCQGFSLAGFRNPDDPRNKLFIDYVDVLKHFMPKLFIMENVEGMKSMEGGKVYQTICETFESLGYNVQGKFLFAHQFGVPQKRKRLITIGIRKDINIPVEALFPTPLDTTVTAYDAIGDLENVECKEEALQNNSIKHNSYINKLNSKR